jgi:regulator of sigma E protease
MIAALQLILSLSILVLLHELGHFIPAKLFKTKVEKFYLFFDPWFSLFKVKKGETEYGIGWLPLGGYVKIAGMIDESLDKEQLKKEPQPWEFRSKPAWQRLIIMIGGVSVNALLGIIIYTGVLYCWGEEYLPAKNAKYGIVPDSVAIELGLKAGDKIISIDNKPVDNFFKIPIEIIFNQAKTLQIEREGQIIQTKIPKGYIGKLIKQKNLFAVPRVPFIISDFTKDSPAKKAGLKKDDQIIEVNGVSTRFADELTKQIKQNKGSEIYVKVKRGADTLTYTIKVNENGMIGIANYDLTKYLNFEKKKYSLWESVPAGINKAYDTFDNYIKQLKLLFSPEVKAYESVGGFISIGSAFGQEWQWDRFWTFTAFLSIVLAIMNILPIPALDGGHIMFLIYEIITRRKPNEKVMEYAQIVGMVLLLSLMILANGNDIIKLFKK